MRSASASKRLRTFTPPPTSSVVRSSLISAPDTGVQISVPALVRPPVMKPSGARVTCTARRATTSLCRMYSSATTLAPLRTLHSERKRACTAPSASISAPKAPPRSLISPPERSCALPTVPLTSMPLSASITKVSSTWFFTRTTPLKRTLPDSASTASSSRMLSTEILLPVRTTYPSREAYSSVPSSLSRTLRPSLKRARLPGRALRMRACTV